MNSLLTGNFTGKFTISSLKAAILEHETAVLQGLFSRFPKRTIREIFPKSREFQTDNRDFFDQDWGYSNLKGKIIASPPSPRGVQQGIAAIVVPA
jgi:hypothetical protein